MYIRLCCSLFSNKTVQNNKGWTKRARRKTLYLIPTFAFVISHRTIGLKNSYGPRVLNKVGHWALFPKANIYRCWTKNRGGNLTPPKWMVYLFHGSNPIFQWMIWDIWVVFPIFFGNTHIDTLKDRDSWSEWNFQNHQNEGSTSKASNKLKT